VDGHEYGSSDRVYTINAPALPDGVLHLQVKAYNDLGVVTDSDMVTVTKGEPCSSASSCLEGQQCDEGACTWPEPTLALGDECTNGHQCVSGLCPSADNGDRFCSQVCIPGVMNQCPADMECLAATDGDGACWPLGSEGGGCGCEIPRPGDDGALPVIALGLFIGVALLRLRRRRD
jgi:hypothetical protein